MKLAPNNVVKFDWKGLGRHGVYRIPTGECPLEFKHSPSRGIIELAPVTDGGEYATKPHGPWHLLACLPGDCSLLPSHEHANVNALWSTCHSALHLT